MQHKFKKKSKKKGFQKSAAYKNKGIYCLHLNTEKKHFCFAVL